MIQIIEVALSLFILMFFFHALLSSKTGVYSHDDILATTYSAIMSLDSSGLLREHIYFNDTSYIKSFLVDRIPFPVDVFVCFYNQSCNLDILTQESGNRYVLTYYMSGYEKFDPAKLVVVIYV